MGSGFKLAEHLEQLATSVPQVESANCVVFGNTAIVGINVAAGLDRSRVGTLKYSVSEALRKDPYGVDAIVTADMDLAERIHRVRQETMNGKPISGFTKELSEIIGRIVPQLPRDTLPAPDNQPPDPQLDGGL
jgi:YhcN/YlaJ family sporulation lipoprotein